MGPAASGCGALAIQQLHHDFIDATPTAGRHCFQLGQQRVINGEIDSLGQPGWIQPEAGIGFGPENRRLTTGQFCC